MVTSLPLSYLRWPPRGKGWRHLARLFDVVPCKKEAMMRAKKTICPVCKRVVARSRKTGLPQCPLAPHVVLSTGRMLRPISPRRMGLR